MFHPIPGSNEAEKSCDLKPAIKPRKPLVLARRDNLKCKKKPPTKENI
jgi:hypothetical protein